MLNPIAAQVVTFIRKEASDDVILDLVKAQLGGAISAPPPGWVEDASIRPVRLIDTTDTVRLSRPRRRARRVGGDLSAIQQFILQSRGASRGDVAKKFRLSNAQASASLKALVDNNKISRAGDRRSTRYAGTARNAMLAARDAGYRA